MSKEKLSPSLILLASEILGDTANGLSGSHIAQHSNYYAVEYNTEIPYPEYPFPPELPNKRTALRENLKKFNKPQQIQIIETLCNLDKFSENEKAQELLVKIDSIKTEISTTSEATSIKEENQVIEKKEPNSTQKPKESVASSEPGPTKKLQFWQILIGALALIVMIYFGVNQMNYKSENANEKSSKTEESVSDNTESTDDKTSLNNSATKAIKPTKEKSEIDKQQNDETQSFQTRYLSSYTTVDAYDGDISITNEGVIEYVNEKISLKVSSPKSDLRKYDGLTIGDKINYGEYEIKLYDLKRNVSTYSIELRIYK